MTQHQDAYAQAGVDISAGQKATDLMKSAVQSTYGPEVLAGLGAFGGLFDASALKSMAAPVLVASTDGVGTKTKVAAKLNRWGSVGQDLVNHCINDILVQGAKPLFFLDYVASAKLDPAQIAAIVEGVALACRQAGCALLGGETAEMPGVYHQGEVDLVGTIIGVVDKAAVLDGRHIQAGDAILGLPSTGLHTNGFTLARSVLAELDWQAPHPKLNTSPGEALLAVHQCYLPHIASLQAANITLRGLAHITGGGLIDNLPRILPAGLGAHIQRGRWPELPIFGLMQALGNIPNDDMFHAFNMGLGMLAVIPAEAMPQAQAALSNAGYPSYAVGEIIAGQGVTILE